MKAKEKDVRGKRISILGCGWLGLPLGERLVALGHDVKGSTTAQEKLDAIRNAGMEAFSILLDPQLRGDQVEAFLDSEILVINIPPGRRREDVEVYHPRQIESLLERVTQSPIRFVVFVSSTSVYPDLNRTVHEEDALDPPTPSGRALLKVEKKLLDRKSFDTTVIRFGGLIGGDRHPARFLSGKADVKDPDAPVNLIHREDCIRILVRILERNVRNEVLNAVCDGHPTRREYYCREAEELGIAPPTFSSEPTTAFKIVSNSKLRRILDYVFVVPSPWDSYPEED